jgi:hypothetical protein
MIPWKTALLRRSAPALLLWSACGDKPAVPEHPTWADVQPILTGECSPCHGSTASTTGSGYRLDFYDMTMESCGEAARALPAGILAGGAGPAIIMDVTPPAEGGYARMPPAPGPVLHDWERETLLRWARQPVKGPAPANNHAPTIQVSGLPKMVDTKSSSSLRFSALIADADNDAVVGLLKIAGAVFAMPSSGSFAVEIPAQGLPAGSQRLSAVLCDGWTSATVDLGPIDVTH